MSVFTAYDASATPATALSDALFGAAPGITVDAATLAVVGAPGSIDFYDGSLAPLGIGAGLLITTGTTPGTSNTDTGFGVDNGMAGDPDLDAVVNTVFQTVSYDATTISFDFTVTDPSITGVSFNVVFGSEEYPEWVDQFVDVAVVLVNGQNVATFGDPMSPLSVISSNLAAGYFQDNATGFLPIEYDGVSHLLRISAPVHQGVNTIKIGIADTGDHILDSGMFISGLVGTNISTGGTQMEVPCTEGADDKTGTSANELYDAKGGNDVINAMGGDDVLLGGDGKDRLKGGDGKDTLDGGAKSNLLDGGAGDDTIISKGLDKVLGGAGVDLLKLDLSAVTAAQTLDFSTGADQHLANGRVISGIEKVDFHGGVGSDHVTGGALDDSIDGGAGADVLAGAGGRDVLSGGLGSDTFVFRALSDSAVGASASDEIMDFSRAQGDRIDLSAIDAVSGGADDAFFLGGEKFHHTAGELIQEKQHPGLWLVSGDVNGDGQADFSILVHTPQALSAGDLVL